MKKLTNIAIAGAGGIGQFLVQFLYNYGAERDQFPWTEWKIDIYDDDIVEVSNLLHQNFNHEDLGKQKAKIAADKYVVDPVLRFMTKDDFDKYDLIFSCVDSMKFRKELYEFGYDNTDLTWIDGRCNSRNIGVFNSGIKRQILEKHITNEEVRGGCLREVDKTNKISHATPLVVAGVMTQLFLNHLREEMPRDPILLMI